MTASPAHFQDFKSAVIDALQINYFQFKGRAARPAYWWFFLFYFVVFIALEVLGIDILSLIVSLGLILPSLGAGVRRLHDINRSGWWLLVGIIPLVGWLVTIYWMIQPGTPGINNYGPAPTVPTASTTG